MNQKLMKQATKLTIAQNSINNVRQLQKKIKEYELKLSTFTKPEDRGKAKTIQDKLNLFKKKLIARYDSLIQTYTKNKEQLIKKHFKTNIVKGTQQGNKGNKGKWQNTADNVADTNVYSPDGNGVDFVEESITNSRFNQIFHQILSESSLHKNKHI